MKAKATLSKNKLFSLLSYVGMVHDLPALYKKQINKAILKFLVPFLPSKDMSEQHISNKLMCLAAPAFLGGVQVDHISLHMELLLLKPVMQYIKCLVNKITQ